MQPTAQTGNASGRIVLLDVFRGFALMGIFVVNIVIMNSTFLNQDAYLTQFIGIFDQATQRILQLFFYTKFFPIFSLLFGLGISMQAMRLMEKKEYNYRFFLRRMVLLFLFGALHILLLWSGDVLHLYAILGLSVPLFLRLNNKVIWILILGLMLFPYYDTVLEFILSSIGMMPGTYLQAYDPELVRETIRSGGFTQNLVLRLAEYHANLPMLLAFLAPMALAMFLLGLYLGKNRLQYSLGDLVQRIKWPMIGLAVFTNLYRVLFLFVFPDLDFYRDELLRPFLIKGMVISDVFLGVFYLWVLGWAWQRSIFRKVLSPLRYAGRMALTNYIFQSVVGLLLFSSYGLGLYETMSPIQTFGTALLVFTLQVLGSKAWLKSFRYGPLEWLWRCFTYRKRIPLRLEGKGLTRPVY